MFARVNSLSIVLCFAGAVAPAQTASVPPPSRTSVHQSSYDEQLEAMTTQHWADNPAKIHARYRSFLMYVCEEDSHVKRMHTPEGQERAKNMEALGRTPWTDRLPYETLMDLQPAEVQSILATSLEGCHELNTVVGQYTHVLTTQFQQYSPEQRSQMQPPELKALSDQEAAIVDRTRANLKATLAPESFQKMETYVFIGARENLQKAVPPSAHNQTVSSADLPPHQTPLRIRYMFFLVKLGHMDERVRFFNSPEGQQEAAHLASEGQIAPKVRPPYETMIGLTHDQVETMLAIALDGYRSLAAKEQEQKVAIKEYRAQHSEKQLAQTPIPTNLQQLNDERWAIPEQTAMKLKQALGEDGFNKLDAWVTKHNGQPSVLKAQTAAKTSSNGSMIVQPAPAPGAAHE
jgi:hypothetical protein